MAPAAFLLVDMTFSMLALSITKFSITTFSIMPIGIGILSMMTFRMTTLTIIFSLVSFCQFYAEYH